MIFEMIFTTVEMGDYVCQKPKIPLTEMSGILGNWSVLLIIEVHWDNVLCWIKIVCTIKLKPVVTLIIFLHSYQMSIIVFLTHGNAVDKICVTKRG